MLEPEAIVAGLRDMAVMREAVQQRCCPLRIAQHACPLAEAQVCRDHHARALVELGEQMERKGST